MVLSLASGLSPPVDDELTRAEKVEAARTLLEEISSKRQDENANGLPDELATAVNRWTNGGHHTES